MLTVMALFMGVAAVPANAATVTTVAQPAQTLTFHSVQFSDPNGSTMLGGNAYDRQTNEIGVNKDQANTALATITPGRVAPLVQFVSAAANTATVSQPQPNQAQQTITVTGVARGQTSVFPRRSPSSQLGVFVFTPFVRTIAFHIINDNAGNNAGVTTAQVQAVLAQANTTWGDQANITLGPNPTINTITVPQNLGTSIDIEQNSISSEEQAVIDAAKNTAVAFNVYFVNSLQVVGLPAGVFADGLTRLGTGDIFVGANSTTLSLTGAHELGHALGLTFAAGTADYTDAPRQYQLMFFNTSRGSTITPAQGDLINPAH